MSWVISKRSLVFLIITSSLLYVRRFHNKKIYLHLKYICICPLLPYSEGKMLEVRCRHYVHRAMHLLQSVQGLHALGYQISYHSLALKGVLLFPGVFSPCFYLFPCYLISIAAVLGATRLESGDTSIQINAEIPNGICSNKSDGHLITHFLLGNKVFDRVTALLSNLTTDCFQHKEH